MKKNLKISFFILCCLTPLCFASNIFAQVPAQTLISIVKAEDELRFDQVLEDLMKNADAKVRARAALAAGRIGDEQAISALTRLLQTDNAAEVRATAVFALGEIESIKAADAILKVLQTAENPDALRARAVEAAGKIAAANAKDEKAKLLGAAILAVLETENARGARANKDVVLLGLTAALRARPEKTDATVAKFLTNTDARIRADAGNTMSRVRAKNANDVFRKMLVSDADPNARANAARALGAAEDKEAFDILLNSALTEQDSRVRVSAIRSLGGLKNANAAPKLIERGEKLLADYKKSKFANPNEKSELLEIATVTGRLLPNTNNEKASKFLDEFRFADNYESPEIEIAFAQVSPASYLKAVPRSKNTDADFWKQGVSTSQGLAEFSKLADKGASINPAEKPENILASFLNSANSPSMKTDVTRAVPDILRAYASFKSNDLVTNLLPYLKHKDIIVRATTAELLSDFDANRENISALTGAFSQTKNDKMNDAALAILDALEKQYKKLPSGDASANVILKTFEAALDSPDYLVRRKTVSILKNLQLTESVPPSFQRTRFPLKNNAPGEFRTVRADYARAVARKNGTIKAILTTEKGNFTIEFFPEDAPLTVDNFVRLARSNYFNGLAIHRVVPNFVMQDGDPRGDGNGGPGWQIRCELNMRPFERGAVGMALSGKDTGGSQWFVTHSPQPHLDGGYTVFGRVNETDMKIVDNLVRGDKILSVKIVENVSREGAKTQRKR